MKDQLTIQIPYELARFAVWQRSLVKKYETNQLIKALDTWLILKADSRPSFIQSWNDQKKYLLQLCKCSESIFRHRMKILKDLQLATLDRREIRLCTWDQLARVFEIDVKKKLTVQYNINGKEKLYEWIIATEIKDNQQRQSYMILKQVNKNPAIEMKLTSAMIKAGADPSRIKDPGYFLAHLKALYLADFVQASEIHEILIDVRPDTNRGVKGIAAAWKARHPMTATYWKRKLETAGIIDISKLQVQSEDRNRNKHCRVIWLKKPQQTLLCLCDQILVLQPWLIQNLLAA